MMSSWIIESHILAPSLMSFAIALGLHIAVRRIWRKAPMSYVLTGSLAAGALFCILWLWIRPAGWQQPGRISDVLAALAVYGGLMYVHADLLGFHRTSIRLQALRFIHRRGGTVRRDELLRACGAEPTVDQRLAQYLRSGDLVLIDGRYRMVRRRILYVTRGFRIIRRLLLGTSQGNTSSW